MALVSHCFINIMPKSGKGEDQFAPFHNHLTSIREMQRLLDKGNVQFSPLWSVQIAICHVRKGLGYHGTHVADEQRLLKIALKVAGSSMFDKARRRMHMRRPSGPLGRIQELM